MDSDRESDDRRITYFAATHTRGKREMFGIRAADRGKHIYVIGKTGMGKSTMLENMAIQDIQNGEGICFIDPHGSTAEKLLDFIPHDRINDVIYFAPFDTDYPLGFNVMEDVGYDKRHLVVSGLMGALKRIWVDAWSARMEYILQNTLLALLEYPGSTLLDVNRMLTNKTFRTAAIEKITDPVVRAFWTEEFAAFTDTYTREATPAIQNKIGQFTANPLIRHIVGQPTSSFDLRKAMDEKKIFIVNLSKGRMGESNASLLGSMLTVKIYLAAMSRADEPAARMAKLPRCYFYVDEFQSMMNESFADILSESRKYKLALTLANQYIEQMEEEVRDAVFGNVGTLICFRVGPFDAEVLETVFEPTFTPEDLVGLGIGQIYLTLMIDGVGSKPFSAETIPPIEAPAISYRDDVINQSRKQYGRLRTEVEAMISAKQREFVPPPPQPKEKKWGGAPKSSGSTYGTRPRDDSPRFGEAGKPFTPTPRQDEALGHRPTDEAGTFDRRTGEFVRREEQINDRVYTPRESAPRPYSVPSAPAARSLSEEDQRSALRAAIQSVRSPEVPAARSPAEILREQQIKQAQMNPRPHAATPLGLRPTMHTPPPRPHVSHAAPQSASLREQRREFVVPKPVSPPAPPPPQEQEWSMSSPRPVSSPPPPPPQKPIGTGEVSPKTLRQILNGGNLPSDEA